VKEVLTGKKEVLVEKSFRKHRKFSSSYKFICNDERIISVKDGRTIV